jgi:hypothetical protein
MVDELTERESRILTRLELLRGPQNPALEYVIFTSERPPQALHILTASLRFTGSEESLITLGPQASPGNRRDACGFGNYYQT